MSPTFPFPKFSFVCRGITEQLQSPGQCQNTGQPLLCCHQLLAEVAAYFFVPPSPTPQDGVQSCCPCGHLLSYATACLDSKMYQVHNLDLRGFCKEGMLKTMKALFSSNSNKCNGSVDLNENQIELLFHSENRSGFFFWVEGGGRSHKNTHANNQTNKQPPPLSYSVLPPKLASISSAVFAFQKGYCK